MKQKGLMNCVMDFLLDLTALVHYLCVGCTAKTCKPKQKV
jgi:hypothetical protein